VRAAGREVLLGAELLAAQEDTSGVRVPAAHRDGSGRLDPQADGLVSCAVLQADRVAGVRGGHLGTSCRSAASTSPRFVIQCTARQVRVLNAPSPAPTAALEIARHIAAELTL
jgi:L-2-hydroxyglutarate oxidase LhgO